MKLGEFQEKFRVRTRYSVDSRRWNAEHRECDVICYAVAGGDTGWRCWAVIYQGPRKVFSYLNGVDTKVENAWKFIKTAKVIIDIPEDAEKRLSIEVI